MKQFDIKIFDNINIPFLSELIDKLEKIGCNISEKNGNIHVEYEEHLENKLKEIFK